MSPRIESWRVSIGWRVDVAQSPIPGPVGFGKSFTNARPAGLSKFVGILLPGKQPETSTPGLHTPPGKCGSGPVSGPLKSPVFSAAVGTLDESTVPRFSRRHSSDQKKKIRFLMIGPLKLPPKLLYFNWAFGCPARFRKNALALSESLRKNSKKLPRKSFDPPLVIRLITAPCAWPNSALKLLRSTRNS